MTVRKDGQAKVWLVLASLIMIFAGMSGILSNTLGVFFSAMVEDMGFRTGDLSVYYMIKSLVGAAAVTAVTRLFVEKNGKHALYRFERGGVVALQSRHGDQLRLYDRRRFA